MIAGSHRLGYGLFVAGACVFAAFGLLVMLKCFGPLAVASKTYPEGPIILVSASNQSS